MWAERGELSPWGVESFPCSSGLCVCLPSCLQRSCDPVLACHLSCLLPSHLCICQSPSCPHGKMMLSHRALTYCHCRLLPGRSAAARSGPVHRGALKRVCVPRSELCVLRAHAVQYLSAFRAYPKVNTRSSKGLQREMSCVYSIRSCM